MVGVSAMMSERGRRFEGRAMDEEALTEALHTAALARAEVASIWPCAGTHEFG